LRPCDLRFAAVASIERGERPEVLNDASVARGSGAPKSQPHPKGREPHPGNGARAENHRPTADARKNRIAATLVHQSFQPVPGFSAAVPPQIE
jgi:hypothetical protein